MEELCVTGIYTVLALGIGFSIDLVLQLGTPQRSWGLLESLTLGHQVKSICCSDNHSIPQVLRNHCSTCSSRLGISTINLNKIPRLAKEFPNRVHIVRLKLPSTKDYPMGFQEVAKTHNMGIFVA